MQNRFCTMFKYLWHTSMISLVIAHNIFFALFTYHFSCECRYFFFITLALTLFRSFFCVSRLEEKINNFKVCSIEGKLGKNYLKYFQWRKNRLIKFIENQFFFLRNTFCEFTLTFLSSGKNLLSLDNFFSVEI